MGGHGVEGRRGNGPREVVERAARALTNASPLGRTEIDRLPAAPRLGDAAGLPRGKRGRRGRARRAKRGPRVTNERASCFPPLSSNGALCG
jgi:hypothetical protein